MIQSIGPNHILLTVFSPSRRKSVFQCFIWYTSRFIIWFFTFCNINLFVHCFYSNILRCLHTCTQHFLLRKKVHGVTRLSAAGGFKNNKTVKPGCSQDMTEISCWRQSPNFQHLNGSNFWTTCPLTSAFLINSRKIHHVALSNLIKPYLMFLVHLLAANG